jgi:hypothetical protein
MQWESLRADVAEAFVKGGGDLLDFSKYKTFDIYGPDA